MAAKKTNEGEIKIHCISLLSERLVTIFPLIIRKLNFLLHPSLVPPSTHPPTKHKNERQQQLKLRNGKHQQQQ